MSALATLVEDHRLIADVLQALGRFAAPLPDHETARADLAQFAEYLRFFADIYHHEKEEDILLPALARNGFSWERGVLPTVRREHRQERYFVRTLAQSAAQTSAWSDEERRHITTTIRDFIEFQRRHVELEETELFPAAERDLDATQLGKLETNLREFDARAKAGDDYQRLHQIGLELVKRYGARPEAP